MLTDGCRSCPEPSSCVNLCPKLKALIPEEIPDRVDKFSVEIPASDLLQRINERREDSDEGDLTEDEIYDFKRGIDTAARFGADSDLDVEWHKNGHLYLESDLTSEDYKFFKGFIHTQIRNPIQKNRLITFLGCASITIIAQRSNTSKQNIQKQLSEIFRRLAKKFAQREVRIRTPHQLKEWYLKLKPADGI